MFYVLNDNVFFVKGQERGCIYDFRTSRLYSVNRALSTKLDLVSQGKLSMEHVDSELESLFGVLLQDGILVLSETSIPHNIEEIRTSRRQCSFAWIEITNQCNLRCRHCYNESDIQCEKTMSFQNYTLVIDSILRLGIRRVQIIGGEPFFHKRLLREMLDYTVDKFDYIEIFTNGTLIDSSWLDFLAQKGIHVALSVYSYNADTHDMVTGVKGSFLKTNRTIEALKCHGIPYRVCNILMNGVQLGERTTSLYELSSEKDIVRMSGRASFSLLSDDLIRQKLITKKSFQSPIKREFASRLVSGHNCFRDRIYISADLQVFPCVMERRIKHCTVDRKNGISLDSSIQTLTKNRIEGCCKCEYRYACFDCRPNSLSGNLLEKPWYCTYHPESGTWENEDEFIADLRKRWGE